MGALYELWLCDARGNHLWPVVDYTRVLYTRAVSGVGMIDVTLPGYWQERITLPDSILQVSRLQPGRAAHDTAAYFLRWDETGGGRYRVGGYDLNYLVTSRITAGSKGSASCTATDSADDVMKYFVRYHLGASCVDTARDLSSYGLSIEADVGAGVSLTKSATRRDLGDVLADLVESSASDGTPCFWGFEVTGTDPLTFTFVTRSGQWGLDRTSDAAQPLVLSEAMGTLQGVRLRRDYTDEVTYVYAAGAGDAATRVVAYVTDSARSGVSPWNRREVLYSNPQITTAAALQDAATAVLQAGCPVVTFTGQIAETDVCRYGRDWKLGDAMTARVGAYEFDVRADRLRVTFTRKRERIECRLEGVGAITLSQGTVSA